MRFSEKTRSALFYFVALVAALPVHYYFWPHPSGDWGQYFGSYIDVMQDAGGGWQALSQTYGNTSPPFTLILLLASVMPAADIFNFKAISYCFVGLLAAAISRFPRSRRKRFLCFFAILIWPSVVVNAALWGQSDTYYTSFLILTLLAMTRRDRRTPSHIQVFMLYGLAFSLKLQSCVFILPLFFYVLTYPASFKWIWVILAPYFTFSIPHLIAGRSVTEMSSIYFRQTRVDWELSRGAANIWQIVTDLPYDPTRKYAIIFTILLSLFMCVVLALMRPHFNRANLLRVAFVSSMMVPFFLPHMHERYFFAAEMVGIALAQMLPRYTVPVLLLGASNVFVCTDFLYRVVLVPLKYLGIMNGCILAFAILESLRSFSRAKRPETQTN
jgi:hypothetical protein